MEWLRAKATEVRRDEGGFTLPEVLVVIAILGILLAIGIIIWLGILEQRRVDAAANQLASDLRLAHTSATNQLTDWRVIYTPNSTSGSASTVNCGGTQATYCLVRLSESYPGAGSVTVVENIPRFFPDGTKVLSSTNPLDPADAVGTFLPSVAGTTVTMEFNSDGTARALGGFGGGVTVSSIDNDPPQELKINAATSRVRFVG